MKKKKASSPSPRTIMLWAAYTVSEGMCDGASASLTLACNLCLCLSLSVFFPLFFLSLSLSLSKSTLY